MPVPAKVSAGLATALDVTPIDPVTFPVEVGVKLTVKAQDWPTFNEVGTVGKLVPQLLVSPKPAEGVTLVRVTA